SLLRPTQRLSIGPARTEYEVLRRDTRREELSSGAASTGFGGTRPRRVLARAEPCACAVARLIVRDTPAKRRRLVRRKPIHPPTEWKRTARRMTAEQDGIARQRRRRPHRALRTTTSPSR